MSLQFYQGVIFVFFPGEKKCASVLLKGIAETVSDRERLLNSLRKCCYNPRNEKRLCMQTLLIMELVLPLGVCPVFQMTSIDGEKRLGEGMMKIHDCDIFLA